MKFEFSRHIFEKHSNIKFHENPSSGSRVYSMRTDGPTGMTKLLLAFRNFANDPKNHGNVWTTSLTLATSYGIMQPENRARIALLCSTISQVSQGEVRQITRGHLSSCPWTRPLPQDVPADEGYLCDKATVLGALIKRTLCITVLNNTSISYLGMFSK